MPGAMDHTVTGVPDMPGAPDDAPSWNGGRRVRPRGPSIGTIALSACLIVVGLVTLTVGWRFPETDLTWLGSDPRIFSVVVCMIVCMVLIVIAVIWSVATIIYNMTHPMPQDRSVTQDQAMPHA